MGYRMFARGNACSVCYFASAFYSNWIGKEQLAVRMSSVCATKILFGFYHFRTQSVWTHVHDSIYISLFSIVALFLSSWFLLSLWVIWFFFSFGISLVLLLSFLISVFALKFSLDCRSNFLLTMLTMYEVRSSIWQRKRWLNLKLRLSLYLLYQIAITTKCLLQFTWNCLNSHFNKTYLFYLFFFHLLLKHIWLK